MPSPPTLPPSPRSFSPPIGIPSAATSTATSTSCSSPSPPPTTDLDFVHVPRPRSPTMAAPSAPSSASPGAPPPSTSPADRLKPLQELLCKDLDFDQLDGEDLVAIIAGRFHDTPVQPLVHLARLMGRHYEVVRLQLKSTQDRTETLHASIVDLKVSHEGAIHDLKASHEEAIHGLKASHEEAIRGLKSTIEGKNVDIRDLKSTIEGKNVDIRELRQDVHNLREDVRDRKEDIRQRQAAIFSLRRALLLQPHDQNSYNLATYTRVEIWKEYAQKPSFTTLHLPRFECVSLNDVGPVVSPSQPYRKESAMYGPMIDLLKSVMPHGSTFEPVDTNANGYLRGRKPDITLKAVGLLEVHPAFVSTIVELKRPSCKLGNEEKGQVLDYGLQLMKAQPSRSSVMVLLSNLRSNVWIEIKRIGREINVTQYHPVSLEIALSYLIDVVLRDLDQCPLVPAFTPNLGPLQHVLGVTKRSIVGRFQWPRPQTRNITWEDESDQPSPKDRTFVAVKRCRYPKEVLTTEIEVLRHITTNARPDAEEHFALPTLLFTSADDREFGFLPAAVPIRLGQLNSDPAKARVILADVLSALRWLHGLEMVHRDVRWDNVVEQGGRGVLIDLGSACPLTDHEIPYEGGYLCCPRELLEWDDGDSPTDCLATPYVPRKQHDYDAYILLVNAVLFPKLFTSFVSPRASRSDTDECRRLQGLWGSLAASPFWMPYLDAAKHSPAKLAELSDVLVTLEVPSLKEYHPEETDALLKDNVPLHVLVSGLNLDGDDDDDDEDDDDDDDYDEEEDDSEAEDVHA